MRNESQIDFKEAKHLSLTQWKKTRALMLKLETSIAKPSGFCTRWDDAQNSHACKYHCEARFLCGGDNGSYKAVVDCIEPLCGAIANMIKALESLQPLIGEGEKE